MEIGAQFYTLRDHCTNLDDFALSLKRIAEIGYKVVQISGVCPYEPEWLDEQLKKNGLRCVLTHFDAQKIKDTPEAVVDFHNTFGCKCIGLGSMPNGVVTEQSCEDFIRDYKGSAKAIKEKGSSLFIVLMADKKSTKITVKNVLMVILLRMAIVQHVEIIVMNARMQQHVSLVLLDIS